MRYPTLSGRGFLLPQRLSNSYDGAGQGRRAANWQVGNSGPVTSSLAGLQTLRNRSRHAVRNDPYASGVIDKLVANHIGTGIVPKSQHPDATLRAAIQTLWQDWTEESDADGQLDFYGQQALAARALFESGECLVRLRPRPLSQGLAVPLQLQLLEPELLPHDKNGQAANGNLIRQGIEFNRAGQRAAYWMYPRHPGEQLGDGSYNSPQRLAAEQILHLYEPLRPGQLRGVPHLSAVLLRLKTLDEFDDAVLFRQEVANLFAGFIRKKPQGPSYPHEGGMAPAEPDFQPMVGLEPGTMQELGPDEDVQFSDPPDAGNNYDEFMRQQLSAIAVGAGLPFEVLSGDLRELNDRILRVILNEFRRRVEQRQYAIFVQQFCRRVRHAWLDMAVLSGALVLPGYARNPRPYRRDRWVPQGWAYIHPVQDVQADQLAVRAGFASRTGVILKRGDDPETIDQEARQDQDRAAALGLRFDSDIAAAQHNPIEEQA
ncbi:phage portal protein [Aquitalea sp. ASV11]|uniref:phage portal protein n=1 Tax=Aquitalea sp. ASV11 TaxID=2795103 RepID=UPI0018EC56BF|nr:phage portal protein [Aquitalea sp. ASV11]